jgi:hypothetical protein
LLQLPAALAQIPMLPACAICLTKFIINKNNFMSEQEKVEKFLFQIDGTKEVNTLIVTNFLSELFPLNSSIKKINQKLNVSLVEDCQKLLDRLIVHLDGLDFRDAKYIAGRLIDEIDKKSKVSISPNG